MSLNNKITIGIFYLIPGNAELFYRETLSSDVILSAFATAKIIKNRNFLYMCGVSSIILAFTPFILLRFFAQCLYLYSIYKYFRYIKYRLRRYD